VSSSQLVLLTEVEIARHKRRHRCACGRVDTEGAGGPPMVFGEPGALTTAECLWFCRRCLRALWKQHDAMIEQRAARLERLELYRQGLLDFQRVPHFLPLADWHLLMERLAAAAQTEAA